MFKKSVLLLTMFTVTACSSGSASPVAPTNTQEGNNQTVTLPTKITLQSVPMILDPSQVPPDPGPDNDKTIAGIDSNNNGIRDDVERWIVQTYPNSAKMRAAIVQRALVFQQKVTMDTDDIQKVLAIDLESSRGLRCFVESARVKNIKEIDDYNTFKQWIAKQTNTSERLKAYLDFDARLSGRVFDSPRFVPADCDLEINYLPN